MLMSSWAISRLIVSTSCFLAWTMSEFERRSAMMSGRRSWLAPGCPGAAGAPGSAGGATPGCSVGTGGVPGAVVDGRVTERHDLRDDLVGDAGPVRSLAHDRRYRAFARALDAHDLVEVARLDRREAVHL